MLFCILIQNANRQQSESIYATRETRTTKLVRKLSQLSFRRKVQNEDREDEQVNDNRGDGDNEHDEHESNASSDDYYLPNKSEHEHFPGVHEIRANRSDNGFSSVSDDGDTSELLRMGDAARLEAEIQDLKMEALKLNRQLEVQQIIEHLFSDPIALSDASSSHAGIRKDKAEVACLFLWGGPATPQEDDTILSWCAIYQIYFIFTFVTWLRDMRF